jgi:hypothetical protein
LFWLALQIFCLTCLSCLTCLGQDSIVLNLFCLTCMTCLAYITCLTWIVCKVAGIVSGNCVTVDLFCKSMDRLVDQKSGFILYRGSQILTWKDSFRVVDHESSHFQNIRSVFTNPTNFHKSLQIFSTIAQNESLKIQIRGLANPDLQVPTFKIHFVDSFGTFIFQNYTFRFDSEGFVYKSCILTCMSCILYVLQV